MMSSPMSAGILFAAVVLVLAMGGCGGGGNSGPLTLQAYLIQVSAAKQQADSQLATLGDPFVVGQSGDAARDAGSNLRRKSEVVAQFQRTLTALEPPADARPGHEEMVAAIATLQKEAADAGDRMKAGVSVAEMLRVRRDISVGAQAMEALSGFEEGCWTLQALAGEQQVKADLECAAGAFAREALQPGDYFKKLQSTFQEARTKTDEIARQLAGALDRAQTVGEKKAAVQRFLDASQGEFEAVMADIEALSPPPEARMAHFRLLDAARELTALTGEYRKQVSGTIAGRDASAVVADFDVASRLPVQQGDQACATLQALAGRSNAGLTLGCEG